MLTYATIQDFLTMKDVENSGILTVSVTSSSKIQEYLKRATRYINRMTRRDFFPWIETRSYAIPWATLNLSIRRFPDAHLQLDQDLLEVLMVNNGIEDLDAASFYTLEHNIYPKHTVGIRYPKYWGGAFGGITPFKRYDDATVTVKAIWGYQDYRYPDDAWIDTLEDVEASGIDASQTTLTMSNVEEADAMMRTRFYVGHLLRIEDEFLEVTFVDDEADTLTVLRGVRGSTAVAHAVGVDIKKWNVIEDIVEATLQVAKTWREADVAAGGRLGVSDMSAGAEIAIPNDPLSVIKSYQRSMLTG